MSNKYSDGLVQDCSNSQLELLQPWTKPPRYVGWWDLEPDSAREIQLTHLSL